MVRRRCLVVTVVWPSLNAVSQFPKLFTGQSEETHHPIQCAIDSGEVRPLFRVKVGGPEDRCTCGSADRVHINSVSSKAGSEDLAVDVELRLGIGSGVLSDLLPNLGPLVCVVPVEVERDKDLHIVVDSRLVGEAQLLVSVRVNADVEGKGIDAELFRPLHIRVIICWASAVGDDANLSYR